MSSPNHQHRRRVFVFDTPRCCTHLFRKLFSAHPQLTQIDIPFFGAWRGPEGIAEKLAEGRKDPYLVSELKVGTTYADARHTLTQAVEAAERGEAVGAITGMPSLTQDSQPGGVGNTVWMQDHVPFTIQHDILLDVLRNPQNPYSHPGTSGVENNRNPTQLPDDLVQTITPVFVIRNPIRSVYSMYKVQRDWTKFRPKDETLRILTSQTWARFLFDWFREQKREVLVVDADDVINDPSRMTANICERVGIDPAGVQLSWQPIPPERQPPDEQMRFYMKEIWASSGIVKNEKRDPKTLHIEAEEAKWRAEFGDEVAKDLRERVETELVNYNYLRSYKLVPQKAM